MDEQTQYTRGAAGNAATAADAAAAAEAAAIAATAAEAAAIQPEAMAAEALPIGEKEIAAAAQTLRDYKAAKTNLENRVVEDELWWELRHWEAMRRSKRTCGKYRWPEPSSAWLFNTILNKHADVMDNYPEPVVLPREPSDRESAQILSQVLPVVMECDDFHETYSRQAWEKLKHGTAVYGVFWDQTKDNGLGDITIRGIDLLRIFWEPGIADIQSSRNLFIVDLADTALLEQRYPQYKGRLGGDTVDIRQYSCDDTVDATGKSVVVDWYYKVRRGGRTLLHYVKFCGGCLLYASENDPDYAARGYYDHGLYPVVFDTLFPEKGTPVGFGYIAVTKDPQMYIDRLSANILQTSEMATRKRFFVSTSTNIDPAQFLDLDRPLVPVEGELNDTRIQEITVQPLQGVYLDVVNQKIAELKDTAGNRDVNSGATGGGVTAAAAIAALQEAGNKTSRDLIGASYRAHIAVSKLCIELMRQFYDAARAFRVTGRGSGYDFIEFSNAAIRETPVGTDAAGETLYRRPVFDLKVRACKRNPFSVMEMNERAKELYGMGFFDPARAQEAQGALRMMEFEGKDLVEQYVREGETLLGVVARLRARMEEMAAALGAAEATMETQAPDRAAHSAEVPDGMAERMARERLRAHAPQPGYLQRVAARAAPEVTGV